MANEKVKDPYRKLTKIMIVLLVLALLLAGAWFLLDQYNKGQHADAQAKIDAENQKLIDTYEQEVAERKKLVANKPEAEIPTPKLEGWDVLDMSDYPVEGGTEVTTDRVDALQGGLMLVNRWHGLPGDFSIVEKEIVSVMEQSDYGIPVSGRDVKLFPNATQALKNFVEYAKEEHNLEYYIVREGYRTMNQQTEYWNKEIQNYPNREGDSLIEAARRNVSFPGTSDYQSGFSFKVDIYSRDDSVINSTKFQTSQQAELLNKEGWKFGIVFRFPAQNYPYPDTVDKDYVTGIDNARLQMDAYRYVGIPHATVMHIKGFSLEEYIDFLVEHPHIQVFEDGTLKYEIYRVAETGQEQTHIVPDNAADFFVSTDNMGGLVAAISY
ncbi:MAG: D-alanyl-D-alanine carboxypeptidase family protein [Eubacteriales bacterium]|nr:D-alanyl-D-alanine carboxypeptidase family protein [Eubacteriales bacterium]